MVYKNNKELRLRKDEICRLNRKETELQARISELTEMKARALPEHLDFLDKERLRTDEEMQSILDRIKMLEG